MTSDRGRPVPPHGSGPANTYRRADPDETAGRLLYRQQANAEARMQMARARKVRLVNSGASHP